MPVLRIDVIEGRSPAALAELLDTTHAAVVEAFHVPQRDRYQIVHAHPEAHMVTQDSGLEIVRSNDMVVIHMTSRPRQAEQKEAFYKLLVEKLERNCGIAPSDVMVFITENADVDWSFGLGRAQFRTGELK